MPFKDKEKLNQYRREYRKKNPEKIRRWEKNRKRVRDPEQKKKHLEWQNNRRHEWKKRIIQLKTDNNGCDKCGWKKHPEVLQFHHRNKEEKKFNLSVGNMSSYSWKKILEEIKKCDILCPNCHLYLHYKETNNN